MSTVVVNSHDSKESSVVRLLGPTMIVGGYLILILLFKQINVNSALASFGVDHIPDALHVALPLIFGVPYGLAVWLGTLVESFGGEVIPGTETSLIILGLTMAFLHTLPAIILRYLLRIDLSLQRMRDLLSLIVVCFGHAVVIAAWVGFIRQFIDYLPSSVHHTYAHWVLVELAIVLSVLPLLVMGTARFKPSLIAIRNLHPKRIAYYLEHLKFWDIIEIIAQGTSVPLLIWFSISTPTTDVHLYYLWLIPVVWIALRHGLLGATLGITATTGTVLTFVAFSLLNLPANALNELHLLLLTIVTGGLLLGQIVSKQKRSDLEQKAIFAVSSALRRATDHEDMLPIILDQVSTLLNAPDVALAMVYPQTGETVIEAGLGSPGDYVGSRLPPGIGISGHVIFSGKPYSNPDITTDPRFAGPDQISENRATACVPLMVRDQSIGAL